MTTKEAIEKIREELPYGYKKRIAEKAGVKPSHVSNFLNGRIKTSKLFSVAVEEYTEYKKEQEALLKMVEE